MNAKLAQEKSKIAHKQVLRKPLTREGHTRLADEHERLARVERPRVVEGIANAAAEGDRSENAEYIYGKKRLRELDKRLRYLDKLLVDAQIIDKNAISLTQVSFGATVSVRDENDETKEWTIVGEGEADYKERQISWKSPVARVLLGRKVGDWVTAKRPAGEIDMEIIGIRIK